MDDRSQDAVRIENTGICKKPYELYLLKLEQHLYSVWCECLAVALVIVECFLAIIELLLDLRAMQVGDSAPVNKSIIEPVRSSVVETLMAESNVKTSKVTDGIHILYMFFLTLFVVEIVFKIIVRQKNIFNHKYEIFDGGVVTITFVTTIILYSVQLRVIRDATAFLIGLRLWKVSNIIFGASLKERKELEQHIYSYRKARLYAEERASQLLKQLNRLKSENEKLKEVVKLFKSSPAGSRLDLVKKQGRNGKRNTDLVEKNSDDVGKEVSLSLKGSTTLEGRQKSPNGSLHSVQDSRIDIKVNGFVALNNGPRTPDKRVYYSTPATEDDLKTLATNKADEKGRAKVEIHGLGYARGYYNPTYMSDSERQMSGVILLPLDLHVNYNADHDSQQVHQGKRFDDVPFESSLYEALSPEEVEVIRRIASVKKHEGEDVPMTSL